ncbi:MAG: prepilin peptidase [Brevundimonas sp.]|uniref:prepilin peptidase n=1 Tax=Brevundimonas sp. TaxID=1871086 RepID=UPI0025C36CDB|nr:A24 family peptidase [Brevundimonas sp.]MBX3476394.1 prepilin peptidase [Brevundimonas sp.]
MIVNAAILGLLGLIVGSFLAAVSVRLPAEEDVVLKPSHCHSCGVTLKPWRLVPVVSWLVLRGRCADCRAAISPRYPLIETAGGLIGVWAAVHGGGWIMMAATAVLGWQLLLIALVDAEHFWLPDVLTFPLIATGIGAAALIARDWPVDAVIGAVAGFGLLWLIAFLYRVWRKRDGLGGGDPFLFAGAGAWIGWIGLPSVLLWACAVGFSLVAARLIVRRRVRGDDRLPFGSLLAVGIWLVWLYGPLGLQPA